MWLSLETISMLKDEDGLFGEVVKYLNNIGDVIEYKDKKHAPDMVVKKEALESFLQCVFTEENIEYGIPYIVPYLLEFSDPEYGRQNPRIRYLMWLAHYWFKIWKDHEDFWLIPKEEYEDAMSVFSGHTNYFWEGSWLYSIVLQDESKEVYLPDYSIQLDSDTIPDTFAKLGMHTWGETDIKLDVGHYETLFVLGWDVFRYIRPAMKWLREFIKKHKEYLLTTQNLPWGNLKPWEEWAWQWAKKMLELIFKSQATQLQEVKRLKKKNKKTGKASPTLQNSPPSPVSDESTISEEPTIPEEPIVKKFAAPRILDTFAAKMREGQTALELSIRDICDDIPDSAVLCIGEYIAGGLIWHTSKYTNNDTVHFDPITPGKSKQFVFCLAPTGQSPSLRLEHTKITVIRPKERKKVTVWDTWWNSDSQGNKGSNTPDQNNNIPSTNEPEGNQGEQEVSIEMSPTDTFVLSLIDSIDTLLIQRESPWVIMITLPERDDFELHYDTKELALSANKSLDWVDVDIVISTIWDDIQTRIESFLFIDAQNKKVETLSQIHFAYAFLRSNLASIGDISKLDLEKEGSFFMTRMKNESGALQLLSSGYSRFFDTFKDVCLQEYGIYLELAQIERTQEVRITLSIKWSDGISGYIISTDKEPYYELPDMSAIDQEIRTGLSMILKNILFFLSSAGRALKLSTTISTQWWYMMDRDWLRGIYERSFRAENDPVLSEDSPRSETERAQDLYNKIQSRWNIKVCSDVQLYSVDVPWTNTKEQVSIYTISTVKNWYAARLLKGAPDNTKVLYRDECLAFNSNGSGHANIYNRIRISERLQKYLTVRMVQIINPKVIHDAIPDPIPEIPGRRILQAWENIDTATQQEFLSCFTAEEKDGKVTRSLNIKNPEGKRVFDILLDALEENEVKIIHHSPGWVRLSKVREAGISNWK
jgi:hypothetical protein